MGMEVRVALADAGYLSSDAFRAHCAEIVRALDEAQARRNFDASDARLAVERCAREARAAGALPANLIVPLKQLMRDVALPEMRTWYRSVLTDRVIVWAIEAFYDINDATPGPEAADG
jgi:hypothetical protein